MTAPLAERVREWVDEVVDEHTGFVAPTRDALAAVLGAAEQLDKYNAPLRNASPCPMGDVYRAAYDECHAALARLDEVLDD